MKSNKLITWLIVIAVVLAIILAGAIGVTWYRAVHVFVEGEAYPVKAQSLDLREKDISFQHYDALQAQLPNCSILWNVPFHGGEISSGATEISVSDLNEEDIRVLCTYFKDLQKVDASACQNYAMLELLQQQEPELDVQYTVSLGGASFAPDTEQLVLKPEDYDFGQLVENLPHLPEVTAMELKMPELTLEQLQELRDTFPEIEITCTVELLGTEYDMSTTELDLSSVTEEQARELPGKLVLLPELQNVNLVDGEGHSQLSQETVRTLMEAAPQVQFQYTFEFYGSMLSTSDEEVYIKQKTIGDEGEANICLALDLLTNCKRFVLDGCKVSNEVMAKIRDDYRDRTKVVWRIYFGEGTSLTDAEILRSTYNVDDDNCHDLIYLEDVRYVDIGHNEWLNGIPFVEGMPNLEVIIVSGAPIKSLEPFKNCKKLRVLEMANCIYVPDLEPLRELESLKMLNIGFTRIKDLSPIEELGLTHLTMVHSKVSYEDRTKYENDHPDCWVVSQGDQPYGVGWRYDKNKEPLPWYAEIKGVFRYPKSPNNVGWYLDPETRKR